jgi:hypothetical protein
LLEEKRYEQSYLKNIKKTIEILENSENNKTLIENGNLEGFYLPQD